MSDPPLRAPVDPPGSAVEVPDPLDDRLEPGALVPVPEAARWILPSYEVYTQAMRGGPNR